MRGLSLEISEFNRLLRLVNYEVYEDYLRTFESDQDSIDDLSYFKVINLAIDLTAGVGSLPSNYYRLIGKPRILDGSVYRKVDMASSYELASREDDFLTQPTLTHPICTIAGINSTDFTQIRVLPSTITKVWIDYLRTLTVPYLDFYINNTSLVTTYLAETTTPYSLPSGYTHSSGTVGGAGVTVTSLTKNLKWSEGDLSLILTKLVNRVAKQLPDELLLGTSTAEQAKSDAL